MKASCVAAAIEREAEVSQFQRSLVLSIKDCGRQHIGHAWASDNKRSSLIVEIICIEENDLNDVVSS